jgi:hypothetical protein
MVLSDEEQVITVVYDTQPAPYVLQAYAFPFGGLKIRIPLIFDGYAQRCVVASADYFNHRFFDAFIHTVFHGIL